MGTPVVMIDRRDVRGLTSDGDSFVEILRAAPEPEQHTQVIQAAGPLWMTGWRGRQGRASRLNHLGEIALLLDGIGRTSPQRAQGELRS